MILIDNAPNHIRCFTAKVPIWKVNPGPGNKNLDFDSGSPDPSCQGDKYGVYWPYIVEVYEFQGKGLAPAPQDLSQLQANLWKKIGYTDPGGVIFP